MSFLLVLPTHKAQIRCLLAVALLAPNLKLSVIARKDTGTCLPAAGLSRGEGPELDGVLHLESGFSASGSGLSWTLWWLPERASF